VAMFPICHIKEKEARRQRLYVKRKILLRRINDGL
jgi:hypothetical protein